MAENQVDVYVKSVEDNDFKEDQIDVRDPLYIFLNQLRNLFSAEPGVVMGASEMGIGLETLVYEYSMNPKTLEKVILGQIHTYCSYHVNFKIDINIKFAKGTIRDVVFIDILVDQVKRLEIRLK